MGVFNNVLYCIGQQPPGVPTKVLTSKRWGDGFRASHGLSFRKKEIILCCQKMRQRGVCKVLLEQMENESIIRR